MKVLKLNRKFFMGLGICPIDGQINHLNQLFGWLVVFILGSIIVSSTVCAINHGTTDMGNAINAAFPAVAAIRVFVSLISIIVFREKVTSLFERLQTFHDQNELTKSRRFFEKANEWSEKTSKYSTILFPAFYEIQMIFIAVISVFYCYVTKGYVQADYLFKPYDWALPWNQHTFFGWMAMIAYSAIIGLTYTAINSTILSFFIGISLYFQALYEYFVVLLNQIDNPPIEIEDLGSPSTTTIIHQNKKILAKRMLREAIEFHIFVKDLFSTVAEIFNATVFFLIFCSVGFASISIFQLELAIRNKQLNIIIVIFVAISSALAEAVIFCYFGAMTTNIFSQYNDRIYEIYWYDLPVPLQKQLIIIMANLQRSLEYRGFGMVTLNSSTFLNIIKAVLSYYFAFKTLNPN